MLKIKKDISPRLYELTILVPASMDEAAQEKTVEALTAVLKKNKGSIETHESWGKKHMAYSIKKGATRHQEAFYHHFVISLLPANVGKLNRSIGLNEDILRHLLVVAEEQTEKSEEKVTQEAPKKAQETEEKPAEKETKKKVAKA